MNLVDGRVWYFVHESTDIFYGTENYTDPYIGAQPLLLEDLKKYGRNAFVVTALQAFPFRQDAEKALERYRPIATYVNPPTAPRVVTEEQRERMKMNTLGDKNPFYGKKHGEKTLEVLQKYRKNQRWINDGVKEQQIPVDSELPDGFKYGRLPRQRKATTITTNNSVDSE